MSEEKASLEIQLQRASRYLDFLKEQKGGFGIRVPADLQLELEEKQREVDGLKLRLGQIIASAISRFLLARLLAAI